MREAMKALAHPPRRSNNQNLADDLSRSRKLHEMELELHNLLSSELQQRLTGGELETVPERSWLRLRAGQLLQSQQLLLNREEKELLARSVVDRIVGLGPLEPLFEDPAISEIMVNGFQEVYIERDGRIQPVAIAFQDEAQLRHVIDRIVAPIGRRIDESSPLVDARLPDGSRVNAIIPPLAIDGPTLTIRRFSKQPFTLERLVSLGTIDWRLSEFLSHQVRDRKCMIVSGGAGSGKTSTMNALGRCISAAERVITIEDAVELNLGHPHLVRLEARPPNIEGSGEVTIRMLVRNALRMRPDRIIVGEVRGGEAFDMLQAMNTGHLGSLTTLHANSAQDALIRLESMVLMAGFDMPVSAIQRMIAGAINLVLQQERLSNGRRVLTSIHRVRTPSSQEIKLEPVAIFDPDQSRHRWLSP
jgi:pilus assembly protein CpaF